MIGNNNPVVNDIPCSRWNKLRKGYIQGSYHSVGLIPSTRLLMKIVSGVRDPAYVRAKTGTDE
jgi:hypothetical protein